MRKEILRLALLQMTLIIYSVLGIAVLLKVFHGSPAPDIFARQVRDWGFLFLFASAGWCVWGTLEMNKPEADHRTGVSVLMSGLALAGVIAAVAVMGTISVACHHSLPVSLPGKAKPSITNRQLPPDP